MKSPTRDISIVWKVFGSITLLVLAIVGFQLWYFPARQIDQLTRALELKGVSLARSSAYQVASAFEFEDAAGIKESFGGLGDDPDFRYVALLKEDGSLVYAQGIDEAGAKARRRPDVHGPTPVFTDGELHVLAPVLSKGGSKGLVIVGFTTKSIIKGSREVRIATLVIGLIIIASGFLVAFLIGRSLGQRVGRIVHVAEKLAEGDLSAQTLASSGKDEIGRVELAFNSMVESQREMVRQIAETAVLLNTAAAQFYASAQQQELGATEQSTAVEETRRTMETLLESSRQIAKTANGVLQNAERTQQNSQVVAERIAALSAHTQRISEILEVIKEIANKSDLLALNAALEGTKAGEAGRGFSLVATQMQRLAENVMGSVRDIKQLTTTITEASQATVLATEESTKLAADTTKSARQIALIIQQQQSGTEQVTRAMDDVSQIAGQTAVGSKEIVVSTTGLKKLCERLQILVGQFRLGEAARRGGNGVSSEPGAVAALDDRERRSAYGGP